MSAPGLLASAGEMVGGTPLVALDRLARGLPGRIAGKIEAANPGGSVKDRIVPSMLAAVEQTGRLGKGATLVEATSGNTGVALAFAATARRCRLLLTMPERLAGERAALLRYLGAEVVTTPGALMRDAVARAEALAAEIPGAVLLGQFGNPANAEAHRRTTALEIWDQSAGQVDVFVAGVGTGGTITGVGQALKARKPGVRVVAVEPSPAAVLSGNPPSDHLIAGIGPGFVPPLVDRAVLDQVIAVSEDEAFACARRLAREEGILCGLSSGAALAAALAVASRPDADGKLIVVLLPDAGERHVTTPLFLELVGPPD